MKRHLCSALVALSLACSLPPSDRVELSTWRTGMTNVEELRLVFDDPNTRERARTELRVTGEDGSAVAVTGFREWFDADRGYGLAPVLEAGWYRFALPRGSFAVLGREGLDYEADEEWAWVDCLIGRSEPRLSEIRVEDDGASVSILFSEPVLLQQDPVASFVFDDGLVQCELPPLRHVISDADGNVVAEWEEELPDDYYAEPVYSAELLCSGLPSTLAVREGALVSAEGVPGSFPVYGRESVALDWGAEVGRCSGCLRTVFATPLDLVQ